MESKQAVELLAALAQETRLAIFRHLVKVGESGASAGSIADALDVPNPTLSFHLKELQRASVIASRRESRSIFYRANFPTVKSLVDFLTQDCCGGHPEVCFSPTQRSPGGRARKRPQSKHLTRARPAPPR